MDNNNNLTNKGNKENPPVGLWGKFKSEYDKNPIMSWFEIAPVIYSIIKPIVTKNLRWLALLPLFILLIVLINKSEILIYKVEYKDNNKINKFNGYGISLITIFSVIILLLFIPFTSNSINNFFFPEIITTENSSSTPNIDTKTPTTPTESNPTPTRTHTPTPSLAQSSTTTPVDLTPTKPTSTPTPPSEEFSNRCLPIHWNVYPTYLLEIFKDRFTPTPIDTTPTPCQNLDILGFAAKDIGLQVSVKTTVEPNIAGIYRSIPEGDFNIHISISNMEIIPEKDDISTLYIMFINSKDALNYSTPLPINSFTFSSYGDSSEPNRTPYPYMLYEKTVSVQSILPTDNILIDCEKRYLNFSCKLSGKTVVPIEFGEIKFDDTWDSIYIGYNAGLFSKIKVDFDKFQINSINPK